MKLPDSLLQDIDPSIRNDMRMLNEANYPISASCSGLAREHKEFRKGYMRFFDFNIKDLNEFVKIIKSNGWYVEFYVALPYNLKLSDDEKSEKFHSITNSLIENKDKILGKKQIRIKEIK